MFVYRGHFYKWSTVLVCGPLGQNFRLHGYFHEWVILLVERVLVRNSLALASLSTLFFQVIFCFSEKIRISWKK